MDVLLIARSLSLTIGWRNFGIRKGLAIRQALAVWPRKQPLLEHAPFGVVILDKNGVIADCSCCNPPVRVQWNAVEQGQRFRKALQFVDFISG